MNDDVELNEILDTIEARNMDYCDDKKYTREELMMKIKSYNFAVIELGLYLNTHLDDEKALCLHNVYTKELKKLKKGKKCCQRSLIIKQIIMKGKNQN